MARFKKETIDEWPLNGGDMMRVSIDHFGGQNLVHIRRWQQGPNGQQYPTKKGAAIAIRKLPRLLKALRNARAHARKIGLLPPRSRSR
jgi:hypothetical protein